MYTFTSFYPYYNSHHTTFSPPPQVNRNSSHRRTNLASEPIDWNMNARLTLTTLVGLQRLYACIPP
jgi:hypothetical protein